MRKSAIIASVALALGTGNAAAAPENWRGEFCMFDPTGAPVSDGTWGTTCDEQVTGVVDTVAGTFSVASPQAFFGTAWNAHDGILYGPGTYTIATTEGGTYTGIVVGPGQLGGHILFDWGAVTNIDVFMVWDVTPIATGDVYVSTDVTAGAGSGPGTPVTAPSGWPGLQMIDGAFAGFSANFNMASALATANNDNASTVVDTLKNIDVLANDIDSDGVMPPPGSSVTLTSGSPTAGGATVVVNGSTFDYDPTGSGLANGNSDSFTYTFTDGNGAVSEPATVNISITSMAAANTAPVTNNVGFNATEDTDLAVNITATDDVGPTEVATDADMDALQFGFTSPTAQGGTVALSAGNTLLTYSPPADFFGMDTFSFTATDTVDDSTASTMTITVASVNDAPVCPDVALGTLPDTDLSISVAADLLIGCTDTEGDALSLDSVTQPATVGSMVANDGAGTLTYTPATDFVGADSFDFTVSDGNGGTVTATVTIQVGGLLGNFTMLDASGNSFGGTNDIIFEWDGMTTNTDENDTVFGVMTIASEKPQPFNGFIWTAHHVRVYGPGTYHFETDNSKCSVADIESTGCPGTPGGPTTLTLVVGPGQYGAHILFDWNTTINIDVINLWDVNAPWDDPTGQGDQLNDLFTGPAGTAPSVTATWGLVSRDADGDGVNGAKMIDGPFIDFSANFNDAPSGAGEALADIDTQVKDSTLEDAFLGLSGFGVLLGLPVTMLLLRKRRHQ